MTKVKNNALVILTPGFPKDEQDTSCLPTVQAFIRCTQDLVSDATIKVISLQYPFSSKSYTWNGVEVVPLNGRNKKKLSRLWIWVKAWYQLRSLHRHYTLVGLFSFWCGECALIGSWYGKMFGLRHLCWISGQDAKKENQLVSWIRPFERELVAMSDFLAAEFDRNHQIKPGYVVPNGLDFRRPYESMMRKDIDIIGVGAFIPLKQFHIFIRVVYELKKIIPSLRAVICGSGPEEGYLKALADQLDLKGALTFTGMLTHDQVQDQMGRSKLLIHTSSYEGFGAVCMEALAAGAHVISLHKPMKQDVLHWHWAANEKEILAKALDILLTEENFNPVIPFCMRDSAGKILDLFSIKTGSRNRSVLQ